MSAPAPDFRRSLRVWWAYTWRSAILIMLPGPILFLAPLPPGPLKTLRGLLYYGYVVWAQVFTLRKVLAMDFPGFSVRVVEAE